MTRGGVEGGGRHVQEAGRGVCGSGFGLGGGGEEDILWTQASGKSMVIRHVQGVREYVYAAGAMWLVGRSRTFGTIAAECCSPKSILSPRTANRIGNRQPSSLDSFGFQYSVCLCVT